MEGQTFSNVLEGLRSNLAESYLADEDLSISQIAWLLGYKEVSALTHAFKRWTGTTPRQARSHQRGLKDAGMEVSKPTKSRIAATF